MFLNTCIIIALVLFFIIILFIINKKYNILYINDNIKYLRQSDRLNYFIMEYETELNKNKILKEEINLLNSVNNVLKEKNNSYKQIIDSLLNNHKIENINEINKKDIRLYKEIITKSTRLLNRKSINTIYLTHLDFFLTRNKLIKNDDNLLKINCDK